MPIAHRISTGPVAGVKKKLGRLILVRHGESIWNVTDAARNLVQRFTGWLDIPLTPRGRNQAKAAGRCLRAFGLKADAVYTSLLRRAKDTFDEIDATAPHLFRGAKVIYTWRLNERHYGSLVGLSKEEAGRKLQVGEEQVMEWRRSWDARPPPLESHELAEWEDYAHAQPQTFVYENGMRRHMLTEKGLELPKTESLEDCFNRIEPILRTGVYPRIHRGDTVLVVAHANVMRAIVRHLDIDTMSTAQLKNVRIPSAVPLIYDFTAGSGPGAQMQPTKTPSVLGMRGRYLTTYELIKHQLRVVDDKPDDNAAPAIVRPLTRADAFLDLLEHGLTHAQEYCDAVDDVEAVVVTDGQLRVVHATRQWQRESGFSLDYARGRTCAFLLGPRSEAKAVTDLYDRLQLGLPGVSKLTLYGKDGAPHTASMTFLPIYNWLNGREKQQQAQAQAAVAAVKEEEDEEVFGWGEAEESLPPNDVVLPPDQDLVPDYFVAKMVFGPVDRGLHVPPLTPQEMARRDSAAAATSSADAVPEPGRGARQQQQ